MTIPPNPLLECCRPEAVDADPAPPFALDSGNVLCHYPPICGEDGSPCTGGHFEVVQCDIAISPVEIPVGGPVASGLLAITLLVAGLVLARRRPRTRT